MHVLPTDAAGVRYEKVIPRYTPPAVLSDNVDHIPIKYSTTATAVNTNRNTVYITMSHNSCTRERIGSSGSPYVR